MTRLSPERLEELYLGTLRLVTEHGFDKITMDQIAEATQSSKATLYRQWGSKSALVVAGAAAASTLARDAAIDTGSLRGDLLEMVDRRVRTMEGEGALIGAILHAVKADAELRAAVRDQIIAVGPRARRADRRPAPSPGARSPPTTRRCPTCRLVLFAPFVLRDVIDDEPADEKYLIGYVDAVLLPALGLA